MSKNLTKGISQLLHYYRL